MTELPKISLKLTLKTLRRLSRECKRIKESISKELAKIMTYRMSRKGTCLSSMAVEGSLTEGSFTLHLMKSILSGAKKTFQASNLGSNPFKP